MREFQWEIQVTGMSFQQLFVKNMKCSNVEVILSMQGQFAHCCDLRKKKLKSTTNQRHNLGNMTEYLE